MRDRLHQRIGRDNDAAKKTVLDSAVRNDAPGVPAGAARALTNYHHASMCMPAVSASTAAA